jgi:hypothetical protein
MNETFHTCCSLASALWLLHLPPTSPTELPLQSPTWKHCLIGLVIGVASHGILDVIKHHYPLSSRVDVLISAMVIGGTLWWARKEVRPLLAACFLGGSLPDLIDLGPQQLRRLIGVQLPILHVFPWHWPRYSGSIYDSSYAATSAILHLVVIAFVILTVARRWQVVVKFSRG